MSAPSSPDRDAAGRLLIIVFAVLVGGVLVATLVAQRMSSRVATLSDSLTHEAMPKVAPIALLRDAILEVQLAVADLATRTGDERQRARASLDARLAKLEEEVRRDLASGAPEPLSVEVASALQDFESAVERMRAGVGRDPDAGRTLFRSELLPAANRLSDRTM